MISGSGTYIDILICFIFKNPIVSFNLRYMETNEFTYAVKKLITDLFKYRRLIVNIAYNAVNRFRKYIISVSPV